MRSKKGAKKLHMTVYGNLKVTLFSTLQLYYGIENLDYDKQCNKFYHHCQAVLLTTIWGRLNGLVSFIELYAILDC